MTKKIITIILSLLIILNLVSFILMPKARFSETENRNLATFPIFTMNNLISGEYIKDLENYLSDHFPLRDVFVSLKTKTDLAMGKTYINKVYIAEDGYLIEDYQKPVKTETLIKVLNNFSENNPDVKAWLMLVPTSIEINHERLPKYASSLSQLDTLDMIYQNVNLKTINVYDTLLEHNQNEAMFYHLDHHWTTDAAYYAYLEFCKASGLEAKSIDEFERIVVSDNFRGTIDSKVQNPDLKADQIIRYLPKSESNLYVEYTYAQDMVVRDNLYDDRHLLTKNQYGSFMYDNNALIKIVNKDLDNDDKILVIKDSFANCFVPFLTEHYAEVHVIDPRFYRTSVSEYLEVNEIDEVLFLYNMNSIDRDSGIYIVK